MVIVTVLLCLYSKREDIIASFLRGEVGRFEQRSGCRVSFSSLKVDGFSSITIDHIVMLTPRADTLLSVEHLVIGLNPLQMMRGEKRVEKALADGVCLNVAHRSDYKNYEFLFSSTGRETDTLPQRGGDWLQRKMGKFAAVYKSVVEKSPKEICVTELSARVQTDSLEMSFYLPEMKMENRTFFAQLLMRERRVGSPLFTVENKSCAIEGRLGKRPSEESSVKIYSLCDSAVVVPYITGEYNTAISFDTLFASANVEKGWRSDVRLHVGAECIGAKFRNDKVAKNDIRCDSCSANIFASVKRGWVEVDSASTLTVNGLSFHPYIVYESEGEVRKYLLDISTQDFPSQQLFDAMPDGLCSHLKGMQTGGTLAYKFHFRYETDKLDSLEFSSSLTPNNFSVEKYGNTDFREVNDPFTYHIYEQGVEVGSFVVGEENPNFVHTDQVSPFLIRSILASEDGFFFQHRGFYESAIRASIIRNIETKRFARGGSTISMQLVKNLWLSREKTLSRKLEEAIIVWLIENRRLVSKGRMFEIYLNIIEWGPMVYGVREASHFFFSKEPKDLTIAEAIFMAHVISRPKKFKWMFDKEQHLKPYLADYYKNITRELVRHEVITSQDSAQVVPDVVLTGRAATYLNGAAVPVVENDSEDEDYIDELNLILNENKEDEENTEGRAN